MKIRYGFVTNSSSSSFILAFDKKEDTQKSDLLERTMMLLNDEDNEKSLEEVLNEFREYCEGELYYYLDREVHERMGIPYGLTHEEMLKYEQGDEYKKIYDEVYEEYCEKKVQKLKEKLDGKNYILIIDEGDEYSSYFELSNMKEVVGIMDYH